MEIENSALAEYLYDLPDERIAKHPLTERDASKLLQYRNGEISHHTFDEAVDLVPENATLFLNNTKVIAARLFFYKETGARIEIFLTDPVEPFTDFQKAFKATKSCAWRCMIGNSKKWKDNQKISLSLSLDDRTLMVYAQLIDREEGLIKFLWEDDTEFLEIIENAGHVPLPPYMNREDESDDKDRYQTVFAELEGAVAAPTASLHFTDHILESLSQKGINQQRLTLHVSAGTFRPIKSEDFKDHPMHNERIIVSRQNVETILNAKGPIIPVGTTALRTLESMYWFGTKLIDDPSIHFHIDKNDPYEPKLQGISIEKSMEAILSKMDLESLDELKGNTEIFCYPGYQFKLVDGLFTNFHMPASTLILLVAAFVGKNWRKIYEEALENDYRFLSYGDTSLLLR